MSDAFGLETALTAMPLFGIVAAACFIVASRSYEGEVALRARDAGTTANGVSPLDAARLCSAARSLRTA
jgi:hypothetical protein